MINSPYEYALLRGLLGDTHAHMYSMSPSFKAAVDTLARMLPAMIDGIAAKAMIDDHKLQSAITTTMRINYVGQPERTSHD